MTADRAKMEETWKKVSRPRIAGEAGSAKPRSGFSSLLDLHRAVGNQAFGGLLDQDMLQRKCACGGSCSHCQEEEKLRRNGSGESFIAAPNAGAPPIVHEVLGSPGQALDAATRGLMESRFGHDFSQVRVHTDARAAESARAVNALAYTVGSQIVFDSGRYAPHTHEGRRLLSHELTHTVQQAETAASVGALSETAGEREAEQVSARVAADQAARVRGRTATGALQRQGANPLDEKAKKIIAAAKDTSKSLNQRAVDAVNSIVKGYYDPSLVDKVTYDEKDPGLTTSFIGRGQGIKGQITVGKYFVENIDSFARRVLQVGHELEHVRQHRAGMGGPAKKNEREFLAFHWEATQPEKAGTGRMPHSTRVSLIDAALKNYYCMSEADRKTHTDKRDELLKLRDSEEKASGRAHTEPPKVCVGKK